MAITKIEKTVASALDGAMNRVEAVGSLLGSLLYLPGLGQQFRPGTPAGIEHLEQVTTEPGPGEVILKRTDYSHGDMVSEISEDSQALLQAEPPASSGVRWWDVRGLHPRVVDRFRQRFGFHTLAAEDTLHVPQRPRVEEYEGHLYIVARLVKLCGETIVAEQMSCFLYTDVVISFQEDTEDSWEPLRKRLHNPQSKLRNSGAGFLVYAMMDMIVDHLFPILEHYRDMIEDLEDEVLAHPRRSALQRIQGIKRDLAVLRRVIWPTRSLVDELQTLETELLDDSTRVYLRDVHGHAVQAAEALETLRESATALLDIYLSAASHRTNETMQVLTVTATLFIPLTFLAGVYGMNFEYIPELSQRWGYFAFWGVSLTMAAVLIVVFRRRGWLGRSQD